MHANCRMHESKESVERSADRFQARRPNKKNRAAGARQALPRP